VANFSVSAPAAPPSGATSVGTGAARTDGIQFTVSTACQLTGYWFYVPAGETTLTGSSYTANLWTTTTGITGTLVPAAAAAGSGTFAAGQWNFISLTPVSLSPGTTYVAGLSHPNLLEFLHNYWSAGGPGASGITSGPITAPGTSGALNSAQQPTTGSANTFPPAASSASWYGIDIQVTTGGIDGGGTGVVASLTLTAPAGSAAGTESGGVTGVVSALTLAAFAGSATGTESGGASGVVASLVLSAVPGGAQGQRAGGVTGATASITLAAPAGSINNGGAPVFPPGQTSREIVRWKIAEYFGGTTYDAAFRALRNGPLNSFGLSTVRAYQPKRLPDFDYVLGQAAGRGMGAVMVLELNETRDTPLTAGQIPATLNGQRMLAYPVQLHVFHMAHEAYAEDAEQDVDELDQAIHELIYQDPTLGGAGFQAGMDAYGIRSLIDPAEAFRKELICTHFRVCFDVQVAISTGA
jgi:hypothetical protein